MRTARHKAVLINDDLLPYTLQSEANFTLYHICGTYLYLITAYISFGIFRTSAFIINIERHISVMINHKLTASFLSGLILSLCFFVSSFAFYRSDTVTVRNSMDIPRIIHISFDANGGDRSMPDLNISTANDARLPSCGFVKTGYGFAGWSCSFDSTDTLIPDQSPVSLLPSDVTNIRLSASWTANLYTVSFDLNKGSGSPPSDISCRYDQAYDIPACSVNRSDHLFLGWNTQADGTGSYFSPVGRIYNLSSSDGGKITLYAQWEDESDSIIETNWNKHVDDDSDNNGTPDRMELTPGSTVKKDPSIKNHTDKEVYGYILASVPAAAAAQSGSSSEKTSDIAVLNITPHWKLIHSDISSNAAAKSSYLYRYDIPLKANGSSDSNPYHSLRRADRSTDLISSFTLRSNISGASDASIDVTAVFIETSVAEDDADKTALTALGIKD